MVNFDNFGGLQSVLKFHIFIFSTSEESVRIRLICEELVRIFSDMTNWYSIFTNVLPIIESEYGQEIPQSQTADNPMAPRGRATQPSRDTRKTN